MFMIVTYPWPVASANVELTGPQPRETCANHGAAIDNGTGPHARHLEEMVGLTEPERMRFFWYRLRLAIRDRRAR